MMELRLWALVLMVSTVAALMFTAITVYCYASGQVEFCVIFMMCSLACVIISGYSIRKVGPHL